MECDWGHGDDVEGAINGVNFTSKRELQHRCAAGPTTATMLHAGPALCCWCMENFTGSTTPYQVLGHTDHTGRATGEGPFRQILAGPQQGPPSDFSLSSGPSVKLWPPVGGPSNFGGRSGPYYPPLV